jgi:hypothetical protein
VDVAEISLIVSGVAALGSIGAVVTTYKLGVRRFDHERSLDDRKDSRGSLADGALELGRMKGAMKDANTAFSRPMAGRGDWPENYGDLLAGLERGKESLEQKLAAVEIRFAESAAVVVELRGAVEAVTSLISISVIARAEVHLDRDEDKRPAREWNRESNEANEKFDAHKKEYLAAAQKLVGAKLD